MQPKFESYTHQQADQMGAFEEDALSEKDALEAQEQQETETQNG